MRQFVISYSYEKKLVDIKSIHPDLLWALKAEASDRDLELMDCLNEILDSYFQGEFNSLQRRGKKLVLTEISEAQQALLSKHAAESKISHFQKQASNQTIETHSGHL